jgi:predicted AAA+ superfamily ATPase
VGASLALWKAYNDRLVEIHRRRPFPIVSFDEEPEILEAKLRAAGEAIGLGPAAPGEPFFTDELRNAPAEGASVPAEIEALYEELRRLAI